MSQVRILSPRPLILIEFFRAHLLTVPDSKGSRFQKRFQFQGRKIPRNFGCPWMPTDDIGFPDSATINSEECADLIVYNPRMRTYQHALIPLPA
jgi:hypothetical protein